MARYSPYPIPHISSSSSSPPSYRRSTRRSRIRRLGTDSGSGVVVPELAHSSPPSTLPTTSPGTYEEQESIGGLIYSPSRFEVILPPSPPSPSQITPYNPLSSFHPFTYSLRDNHQSSVSLHIPSLTSSTYDQIPPQRVTSAITSLRSSLTETQQNLAHVISLHLHQSGFANSQKRMLSALEEQLEGAEREVDLAKSELEDVEREIGCMEKEMKEVGEKMKMVGEKNASEFMKGSLCFIILYCALRFFCSSFVTK